MCFELAAHKTKKKDKCDFWEEFKPYRTILEGWKNKKQLSASQVFADEIYAEAMSSTTSL
jgi:hypothetical protein